jgi:hypothetical protein
MLLKLRCDEPLSNAAFNINLRRYTTEVLQEGIMEFVNTIGKIVHMECHLHGGRAFRPLLYPL